MKLDVFGDKFNKTSIHDYLMNYYHIKIRKYQIHIQELKIEEKLKQERLTQ